MAVFDDEKLINNYKENKQFPNIHSNITNVLEKVLCKEDSVIDLGTCYGLLAKKITQITNKKVIGIDAYHGYLDKAIKDKKIKYVCIKIDYSTLDQLKKLIDKEEISTIVARRIFPEIFECTDCKFMSIMAKMFYESKIEKIIIEGRIDSKRSVNKLHNIFEEVKIFENYYECTSINKRIAVLRRRKENERV